MMFVLALLSCLVWLYLLTARGGFWRAADRDSPSSNTIAAGSPLALPSVCVVIPARNEAETIGMTVGSLLKQDYPGALAVLVVDDHSSDGTASLARTAAIAAGAAARFSTLSAPALAPGWTGKLWALQHGLGHVSASPSPPDYVLFTDADIVHAADSVRALVTRASRDGTILISLMARLHCETLAERAMMPAFIFFFQMLYPFAWVASPTRRIAAAAGGCMLVHRASLESAGGFEPIRNELIDDCALARLLKPHGRIWLGLTERVSSVRVYASLRDIRSMVVRSAYAQLQFSPWWLGLTAVAMTITYIVPPAVTLFGSGAPRVIAALAWMLMALALQPTLRFYAVGRTWGLALPFIAAFYLVLTLESAYRHRRGVGGEWKGRVHCGVSK